MVDFNFRWSESLIVFAVFMLQKIKLDVNSRWLVIFVLRLTKMLNKNNQRFRSAKVKVTQCTDTNNTLLEWTCKTLLIFVLLFDLCISDETRTVKFKGVWMYCLGTFSYTATWQLSLDVQYCSADFWQRSAAEVESEHATTSWTCDNCCAQNAAKLRLCAGMYSVISTFCCMFVVICVIHDIEAQCSLTHHECVFDGQPCSSELWCFFCYSLGVETRLCFMIQLSDPSWSGTKMSSSAASRASCLALLDIVL